MKSLVHPFVTKPVLTLLCSLMVCFFGVVSYLALPVNDLPQVDYPVIQVNAVYPGADPDTMSANIATPLEKEFLQIDGLEQVTSGSTQGLTKLTLLFSLNKDIREAITEVQAAISRAQGTLPADMPSPPSFTQDNPNNQPIMYLALASNTLSRPALYEYGETEIAQKLQTIEGVSTVQIYGSPRAVRIQVNPQLLHSRNLTMPELAASVRAATSQIGAGSLKGSTLSVTLNPEAQLVSAEDFKRLIIAHTQEGPLYLEDVASVIETTENEDTRMRFNGRDVPQFDAVVVLAVLRADGANTVAVAQKVRERADFLRAQLPEGIIFQPVYDRSLTIQTGIADVKMTLFIAFVLVVLVIYIFLGRIRETLIPTVALPLSLLATFGVMYMLGFSIDNLSLMALTLAIGFLVDDAIVFLENTVRRMEKGESPLEATLKGGREIGFTIISTTISLISVFVPLVFMGGQIGRIFQEFSITIIVATIASTIVSLTVTPLMCARTLKKHKPGDAGRFERFVKHYEAKLQNAYANSLEFFLKRVGLALFILVACTVGTVWVFNRLPFTFLPAGDSGFMVGVFVAPEGTSPAQMKSYHQQVDDTMRAHEDVELFVSVSNIGRFLPPNMGIAFTRLREDGDRPPIDAVAGDVSKQLYGIPGLLGAFNPRPSVEIQVGATETTRGKFAYALYGSSREELYQSAQQVLFAMYGNPGFASVQTDMELSNPQLQIDVLRNDAALYGVAPRSIETIFNEAYAQDYTYLIKTPLRQVQAIVEIAPEYRSERGDINLLYARNTEGGNLVPISAVTQTKDILGPQSVNHINGFFSVTIYFNLNPGFEIGQATDFISGVAQDAVPPSLNTTFLGEAEAFKESFDSFAGLAIIAVLGMYVVLGILYNSYVHPLTILLTIPPATFGGLAALWLTGNAVSLYVFVGIFMLMGIVKKNGILVVDFAIARQAEGKSPVEAVRAAAIDRFRPIQMTTLSAVAGILPIALGFGADGATRAPMGITIVAGLLFSQLITLYITPATYLATDWLQRTVVDRIPLLAREVKES